MTEFETFMPIAKEMGTGRMCGYERQLPVFVPIGSHQDGLYQRSLEYLERQGFTILDLRNATYESAIDRLTIDWPLLLDKWPGDELDARTETKLLIACGKESHPTFWRILVAKSLLTTCSALPPLHQHWPKCFVIPDMACVVSIISHDDFYKSFPTELFGPICGYNTNDVPFSLCHIDSTNEQTDAPERRVLE